MAKHMRRVMTLREIKEQIASLPDEAQDTIAYAWLAPIDGCERWTVTGDMFPAVTSLTPYNADEPISKDNPMSFNLEGCC